MDAKIRAAQQTILNLFSGTSGNFALAGGTALELYYLQHRFSWDLDFFAVDYRASDIEAMVQSFRDQAGADLRLESTFNSANRARVQFYTMAVPGAARPLKIDFVEDVVATRPVIKSIDGVRVYSAADLYLHKLAAIAGTFGGTDVTGREISSGRHQARDAFDVYMLSRVVQPLHVFLRGVTAHYQKGMVHWYRAFSRQELKLALLDLEIYDHAFDSRQMVAHLEGEIRKFIQEVIGE